MEEKVVTKDKISVAFVILFMTFLGIISVAALRSAIRFDNSSQPNQISVPSCVWTAQLHYTENRERLFSYLSPDVGFDKTKLGVERFHVSPDGQTLALEDPEALSINLYKIIPAVTSDDKLPSQDGSSPAFSDSNTTGASQESILRGTIMQYYTLARFKTIPDATNPLWKSNKNLIYANTDKEASDAKPQIRSLFLLDLSNGLGKRLDTKEAEIWNLSYNPTLDKLLYTAGESNSASQNLFILDLAKNERKIVAENSTGRWINDTEAIVVTLKRCTQEETRDCLDGYIPDQAYTKNLSTEIQTETEIYDPKTLMNICQKEITFNPAPTELKDNATSESDE